MTTNTNTNKRAGWNKCAGGNFFSKSINVHARLFGTLEYVNTKKVQNVTGKF